MPRAIWTGAISFGLVAVPVRLYRAVDEHDLHFHYVHEPDGSRIGYEKTCKAEGRPVPDDEIVKAFEYEPGEWVYLTDEDFEAAKSEDGSKTIDIRAFVPHEQIDPIFFEQTYYVGPQDGSERVYVLLREAMERSGLAGVAKFVMRDRQHLACLRVRDGAILLERMHFADEIRAADELVPGDAEVDERELEMALELIDRFEGSFEPEGFTDTYREALCEIIRKKQKGVTVPVAEEPGAVEPRDLMTALKASLDAAQRRRSNGRRRGSDGAAGPQLSGKSKDELLELAREADVRGRSQMTKDELVAALRRS